MFICQEKRVAIYKFLRIVLEEVVENKFEQLLNKFIIDIESDFELHAFTIYFKQQNAKILKYGHIVTENMLE